MPGRLKRSLLAAAFTFAVAVAMSQTQGRAQTAPPDPSSKVVLSEQYFKNIQMLRGVPVDEFMDTMGMFAAATGMNCTDCHVAEAGGNWAKYADDNDYKQKTRMMIVMMNTLNASSFAGARKVTCFTCHRGLRSPAIIPNLDLQYSEPPPVDPDDVTQNFAGGPTVDQVLDKYMTALGGAQRVATVTSITAKGTYKAYDDFEMFPLDFYAKAPNQRSTVQHSAYGNITWTYDGKNAWQSAPTDVRPYPVVQLSGGNLEGAAVDALLTFPGRIKQNFTNWRVGPPSEVNGQDVQILQATTPSGFLVKFYFDSKTGLLLRTVRYSESQSDAFLLVWITPITGWFPVLKCHSSGPRRGQTAGMSIN